MTNNLELLKNHLYKLIKEELEGGEEEKQAGLEKVMFDLVLEPANLEAALTALQNSKNYGIYAKNLTDRNEYNSLFGPSNPPQKTNAAWKDWDSMFPKPGASEDQVDSLLNKRLWKIKLVKNNNPEDWEKLKDVLSDKFKDYSIETGNDSFEDFIASLPSSELKFDKGIPFFGKSAGNYFLPKNIENTNRYTGTFKDDQYVVKGDKIIFPQKKNPFETKDYLTKVLKTIMGNAKLQYSLSQQESEGQPATTSNTQGAVEKINFVKTFDTPELANKFKKLIPKDFAPKTTIEGNKITVADITDSQKKNLILAVQKFIESQPKKPVKEDIQAGGNKDVKTYGDLKKVINSIINQKSGATNKLAQTGKLGVDFAIGSNPITNGIKTAYEFYKIWSNQPDTRKVNSWVSKLDIDDETSAIVDDTVEQGFIEDITDTFAKMPDNTPLPNDFNMSVELAKYLKGKYKGKFVAPTTENRNIMKESIKEQVKSIIMEVLQEERFKKGTDIGKKGPGFKKVAKAAEKEYGSKEAGKKVAGAILKKVMNEGEGDTSMDDILLAFQGALDIEDDVQQDQALKAVYNALKDKVKGKLSQAADYAKDKLTQYNDNLEEAVDTPTNLASPQQKIANSKIVSKQTFAKSIKDLMIQLDAGETTKYLEQEPFKSFLPKLDLVIGEKPAAETNKA